MILRLTSNLSDGLISAAQLTTLSDDFISADELRQYSYPGLCIAGPGGRGHGNLPDDAFFRSANRAGRSGVSVVDHLQEDAVDEEGVKRKQGTGLVVECPRAKTVDCSIAR